MPQQNEPPRPHGDPLEREIVEDNQAQRQSDAPADARANANVEASDRADGRGSDANGVPAFDDGDGARRRKQYEDGAELVSKID